MELRDFPVITDEEHAHYLSLAQADIFIVTICKGCPHEGWGARLGCECGGETEWVYKAYDGRYLREGVDVCGLNT